MKQTNSFILSKRRVGTARPGIKDPSKPSPTTSPTSGEKEKVLVGDEDDIQSVYSFPSNSSNNSPIASPETLKKFATSSHSMEIIPCSDLLSASKPKLKLYFGPKNITPFTNLKRQKNYKTLKTSLIMELKLLRPNFQDLLTILETVPNCINERDDEGMTALMLICSSQTTNLSTAERLSFCRIVREKFPKQYELIDNNGLTALHHAVQFMPSPSLRIVQFLLSVYPAAASVLDMSLSLPLHHSVVGAASNSILKLLIVANPASVTQPDGTGLTALDYVKSKVKLPSRRTRALLSVDGVWIDPDVFTLIDTNEPDPEENFAAVFLQHWFRQLRKKNIVTKHSQMKIDATMMSPVHYKQSFRPKPKAPTSTIAMSSWHHDAAIMIQALYRGSFLRMRIEQGKKSVVNIQRVCRGFLCRMKLLKQNDINYTPLARKRIQRRAKSGNKKSRRNWEEIERYPVHYDIKQDKSVQAASKIQATWYQSKTKHVLPALSYRNCLITTLVPFYFETVVALLLYLLFFYFAMNQPAFTGMDVKKPDHLSTSMLLSSFDIVQKSAILSMVFLAAAFFTLKSYLVPLKKRQAITPSTKIFDENYKSIYQFTHLAALLTLTITWALLSYNVATHYDSLMQFTFSLPHGRYFGGIILSLLIIPLLLYMPIIFLLHFQISRKSSKFADFFRKRGSQSNKQLRKM